MKMEKKTNEVEQVHSWDLEQSFSCSIRYDKFINWLRVEFYSFQQEQSSFLTIYFPNGQVQVKRNKEPDATFVSKITVESKCRKVGLKIKRNLSDFLAHIEKYDKLSEISLLG